MSAGARALISPDALQHNLALVRRKAPECRVMAAVKGNAYGHGLITVARALNAADSFAVARLGEAKTLRNAGVDKPLVLLSGPSNAEELHEAAQLACELVIHSHAQLPLLESASARDLVVWLKIDTGMHRLGFDLLESPSLIAHLQDNTTIRELRLMTHLASADVPTSSQTADQIASFRDLCKGFSGAVSVANSAALFGLDSAKQTQSFWGHHGETWVRPGIALYGISPFATGNGADLGLQPVMQFAARLIDVKPIKSGDRVGYSGSWTAQHDTNLGIIAAGYGDGYSRYLPSGTPVLINGRRVPLAGIVSMDLAAVDLGPDASDRVGDVALLWGGSLPVEEIARSAGTIPYQLVTGVMHRESPQIGDPGQ